VTASGPEPLDVQAWSGSSGPGGTFDSGLTLNEGTYSVGAFSPVGTFLPASAVVPRGAYATVNLYCQELPRPTPSTS